MEEFKWPVMPLCKAQLQDINPDDVLNGGLYRRCNTYKGGVVMTSSRPSMNGGLGKLPN